MMKNLDRRAVEGTRHGQMPETEHVRKACNTIVDIHANQLDSGIDNIESVANI